MEQTHRHFAALRQRLSQLLHEALPKIEINGVAEAKQTHAQSPHILNVSFHGVDGEALRADLNQLALSSGSACTSEHAEPSYVLRALGRNNALADSSLRFSFGPASTPQQIDQAAQQVIASVRRLRALSPIWERAA